MEDGVVGWWDGSMVDQGEEEGWERRRREGQGEGKWEES